MTATSGTRQSRGRRSHFKTPASDANRGAEAAYGGRPPLHPHHMIRINRAFAEPADLVFVSGLAAGAVGVLMGLLAL